MFCITTRFLDRYQTELFFINFMHERILFLGHVKFFFFKFFVNHDFNLSCFCAEVTRLSSSLAGMLHVTWEMLVGNGTSGSSVS